MPVDSQSRRKIFDQGVDQPVQPLPPGIDTGSRVVVRGRSWNLDMREAHEDCAELRLSSFEDNRTLSVLWPFDRPEPDFARPHYCLVSPSEWLRHARRIAAEDRPVIHLTSGERPRETLAVLPFQLAPALAMAAGSRRIVLADEVGLGKTAQTGWIIDDLLARRHDARVLIAVPAGVRLQWVGELDRLFAIHANAVDARWLLRTVNGLPAGLNVWTPPGVHVISLDFLKRPDIAASALEVIWDLFVVDEAHVAAAPTDRHKAVDAIARRSRGVVLVTATPFSGDEAAFSSLMSIGCTGTPAAPAMFRRSREDVGDGRRRRHRFVRVRLTATEQRLQRLLERYCREIWAHAPSPEARLAAVVLRKRALSSSAALMRSLRRRQRLLASGEALAVQLSLFGVDTDEEDDEPGGVLGAPGLQDLARERRWLERLMAAADLASTSDSKLRFLRRLLRRARGEPAVIFTEFRDTLADIGGEFPSALRLHGGMSVTERDDVQARFNSEGGWLFATDAAAHGLNLHHRCRLVVSFELPWNPARLEQRIGRVDRIGQTKVVHAATLVARDTAEDFVIANVGRRLARVARTLGPKDRLASFLDDARIAGMAIGGDAIPDLETGDDPVPSSVPDDAVMEADRLSRVYEASGDSAPALNMVAVSALRTPDGLEPGLIAIVRWTLRDGLERTAACRSVILRAPGPVLNQLKADRVGAIAPEVVANYGDLLRERAQAEILALREACLVEHERAVGASLAREIEMLRHATTDERQPGLFDRRTYADAGLARSAHDRPTDEATGRIAVLQASMRVEEHTDIKGLLFLLSRTR